MQGFATDFSLILNFSPRKFHTRDSVTNAGRQLRNSTFAITTSPFPRRKTILDRNSHKTDEPLRQHRRLDEPEAVREQPVERPQREPHSEDRAVVDGHPAPLTDSSTLGEATHGGHRR